MTLDYKGFTEKEIQDAIDKMMWKVQAEKIVREIVDKIKEKV